MENIEDYSFKININDDDLELIDIALAVYSTKLRKQKHKDNSIDDELQEIRTLRKNILFQRKEYIKNHFNK